VNAFFDALANAEIPMPAMNTPAAGQEGHGNGNGNAPSFVHAGHLTHSNFSALNAEGGTNSSRASNDGTSSENSNPSTGSNDTAGEGGATQPGPFHEFFGVNINMDIPIPSGPDGGEGPPQTGSLPPHAPAPPRPRRQRRQWILPPAPGPSLRQRVEEKEREAGLRCFDASCSFGPFDDDDDDDDVGKKDIEMVRQLLIRPGKGSPASAGTSICNHTFHPGCLVSAERVAGWGHASKIEEAGEVQVACPVCRAIGCVSKEDWDEGVHALS
jgi:hypothetical protein